MATAESYERPIELDLTPSEAPRAPRENAATGPQLPSLAVSLAKIESARTAAECDAAAQEIAAGPVGKLPREHALRSQLRAAYHARLGVLIALWWGAWLKLWESVANAHRLESGIQAAHTARQAIPLVTTEPGSFVEALAANWPATATTEATPVTVAPVAPAACKCPIQTRPLAIRGVCPTCNLTRARLVVAPLADAQPSAGGAGSAFGDIAAEAHANANASLLGEHANGRTTLGVGFSSAAGYIEALRRGVALATLREYAGTLRRTYRLAVTVTEQPTRYSVHITGTTAGQTVAEDFTAPMLVVTGQSETRAQVSDAINHAGMVGVAGAVASGVGLAWDGHGEMTHEQILAALAAAELPAEWAPALPSQRSMLGLVMQDENRGGRVCRPELGISARSRTVSVDGLPASYKVRWSVMAPGHGQVGEAAGSIVATVTLLTDDTLVCEGSDEICRRVRAEYARRAKGDSLVYEAGQVTEWLKQLLISRFGAIRYLGWYVPARYADAARRLVAAMAATGWGSWPANPPMPMITCDALAAGLTRGLDAEVDAVLAELATKRFEAAKQKRADISPAVAATLLVKLRDLTERASRVRDVIGGEHVAALRTRLVDACTKIEAIAGDMSHGISALRFANLELA